MIFIGFIYILFKVFWVAQGVLSLATRGHFAVKAVNILSLPLSSYPFPSSSLFFKPSFLSYHTHLFKLRTHTYQKQCTLLSFRALRDKRKFKSKENQLTSQFRNTQDCLTFITAKWYEKFSSIIYRHTGHLPCKIKKTRYKVAGTKLHNDLTQCSCTLSFTRAFMFSLLSPNTGHLFTIWQEEEAPISY